MYTACIVSHYSHGTLYFGISWMSFTRRSWAADGVQPQKFWSKQTISLDLFFLPKKGSIDMNKIASLSDICPLTIICCTLVEPSYNTLYDRLYR